jgi:hypothetical protein
MMMSAPVINVKEKDVPDLAEAIKKITDAAKVE